jgi:transcriptional regulator with XRE-family HTH domain
LGAVAGADIFPAMVGKGQELKALLKQAGRSQTDLAREMSRSSTAIGRYVADLDAGRLPEDTRASMVLALGRLRVSGPEVDALLPAANPGAPTLAQLIAQCQALSTPEQLEALAAALDAPREVRELLRTFVAGQLYQLRSQP